MTVDTLNTAGFVTASLGSLLGLIGSYLMACSIHPFKFLDYLKHIGAVPWKLPFGKARKHIETAAALAQRTKSDPALCLLGLHFIFFGFVLQLLGGFLLFQASMAGMHSLPG